MTPSSIVHVPPDQNILQFTADLIIEQHLDLDDRAADLSHVSVLLPHSGLADPFMEVLFRLTESKFTALIPPWSGTLQEWTKRFTLSAQPDREYIDEHARRLLFIEALQQHPSLFKEENKWQVTQALLELFDELSLSQVDAFESADSLQRLLGRAYGIDDQDIGIEHLNFESKIVYTLWQAWRHQLDDNNLYDSTGDYLSRLQVAAESAGKGQNFVCLSPSFYSRAELAFIERLVTAGRCQMIEYEPDVDDQALAVFISEAHAELSTQTDRHTEPVAIKQRARHFAERCPSPSTIRDSIKVFLAADDEQQVQAIDRHVRQSLIAGRSNIAIISEDRKLSRRLRAFLERSGTLLQDDAGWSLATTQAATIIERWLECIEEDFSAYPLLDCLKSPYIDITRSALGEDATDDDFRRNIYRFEHDLVFHENVSSNISTYKRKLKDRLSRLTHWPADSYETLTRTLDYIASAAEPLLRRQAEAKKSGVRLSTFIDALLESLALLGILSSYEHDDAGLVILRTLESLKRSTRYSDPSMNWQDCRIWLSVALDSEHFTPPTEQAVVRLMTLEQSSHLDFDTIIFAATESQHYPGSVKNSPFFNQSVRSSLGLETWQQQYLHRHRLFCRNLLSSPETLFTACNEDEGEEKPVSPWLQLLMDFYSLAYSEHPDYHALSESSPMPDLMDSYRNSETEAIKLPELTHRAAPVLSRQLIPKRISASAYQRLINCPYQYFSADGLRLKPLEELSDELKKADYGERIHTILQTFHSGHRYYGKAFEPPLNVETRKQAEDYLAELSARVFLSDTENNALHRSWLHRWNRHIPAYISWQMEHQKDWRIHLTEQSLERPLVDDEQPGVDTGLSLYGRLDRIDCNRVDGRHEIIDYKTGRVAGQDEIDTGENVQLSMYALLDEQAEVVNYLSMDSSRQKVDTKSSLAGEALVDNRENNRRRLIEIFELIANREPMHAWGDDSVCSYCDYSGLCRKASWSDND